MRTPATDSEMLLTRPDIVFAAPDIFFKNSLAHALPRDNVAQEETAVLDSPLLRLIINMNKPEAGALALKPLEVIAKTPVIITLHRQIAVAQSLQVLI